MDGDHGLAATGAADHHVRTTLAERSTPCPLDQFEHISARHPSTLLDEQSNRTPARNARYVRSPQAVREHDCAHQVFRFAVAGSPGYCLFCSTCRRQHQLALGLGAQLLVRDVINGMFILIEDQYAVGDTVTVAGVTGEVIEIKPDTIAFFPKDWKGTCRVHETVRKVYMIR